MHTNRFALSSRIAVLYLLIVTFAGIASASSEKVLHSFLGSPGGLSPGGGLVADKAGNLYSVTPYGGPDPACSCGTVFELSPPATPGGAWTETILYGFHADYHVVNIDGNEPVGGLVFDQLGNLYGATTRGGPGDRGVIFELTPPAAPGGTWTEKAIFSFRQDGTQGVFPNGNLVFDDAGNLYGTTGSGGGGGNCSYSYLGCGTVFQLKPPATPDGDWTENTLYAFAVQVGDGANPVSVIYRRGVLYGTTSFGGAHSRGTAYQLASENGVWVAATIYSFSPNRGSYANALILDDAGNLFGTTIAGGLGGPNCRACGTVFELSPPAAAGKPWRETILHAFDGEWDGATPLAGLLRDDAGNLYGTTASRKIHDKEVASTGLVFELSPPQVPGAAWTEKILHNFGGSATGDGAQPGSELILVNDELYGTAYLGGSADGGTAYRVVP